MIKTLEVTLVPPIINTVTRDLFLKDYPFIYTETLVITPSSAVEKEKARKLQRASDFIIFNFNYDDSNVDDICHEVADRIISNKNDNSELLILITDEVVNLKNIHTNQLSAILRSKTV